MPGMLVIRYEGRETVFEYRDLERKDADEMIAAHMQRFAIETYFVNKQPVRREIDQKTLIAEWVENEGTENAAPAVRIPTPGLVPEPVPEPAKRSKKS